MQTGMDIGEPLQRSIGQETQDGASLWERSKVTRPYAGPSSKHVCKSKKLSCTDANQSSSLHCCIATILLKLPFLIECDCLSNKL